MIDTEKAIAEIWALFKETREQITLLSETVDKTSKTVDKTSKDVARVSKDIDALKDKWGKFVEYVLAPGIPTAFQERSIPMKNS